MATQETSLLAQLSLSLDKSQTLPLSDSITFTMETNKPEAVLKTLSAWQNIDAQTLEPASIQITMSTQPRFTGKVVPEYQQDSFVIDINEASTQAFISGYSKHSNDKVTLSDISAYVHDYINDTTYIHGFNIASVVASQRSGDCTEFAVLTTTLARSRGLPARIIVGSVIIESSDSVAAFGHAWSEVWQDGKWQVVDAALYGAKVNRLFYLPAMALENEGPGFTFALIKSVGLMPAKIRNVRSVN